jgi:hypothetical protein
MLTKHQEFMDLRQGGRSIHDYSKLFNHLAQYAPEQVDTEDKKKATFMRGLSTKLKEHLSLSTGGTFPKFLSIAIIADNATRSHKEGKKRKVVAAHLVVPHQSTGWCFLLAPPTHLININTELPVQLSSSGFPTHIRTRTRQHRGLYHHTTCVAPACATDC